MVKCSHKECQRKGLADHDFDGKLCLGLPTEALDDGDKILQMEESLYSFDEENEQYRSQLLDFAANDEVLQVPDQALPTTKKTTIQKTNKTEETKDSIPQDPFEGTANPEPSILAFFKRWRQLNKQAVLTDSPGKIFDDIENDPLLSKYHTIFGCSRLQLSTLPNDVFSMIMMSFIGTGSVKDFIHFDIYTKGVMHCNGGRSRIDVGKLTTSLEANAAISVHEAAEMKEISKSFESMCEILRSSINSISAATSKLEAETKIFEMSRAKSDTRHPLGLPSSYRPQKTIKITGYQCGSVLLLVTPEGKLDPDQTLQLNQNLGALEKRMVHALSLFNSDALSCVASLSWDQITALFPYDPDLDIKEAATSFYKSFRVKYPSVLVPKPDNYIIITVKPRLMF